MYDADGKVIQPANGTVFVEIQTPQASLALASGKELGVYRRYDETVALMQGEAQVTETAFSFDTDSFSVFALGSVPYSGDYIHINSFDQLFLIGTDVPVTDADLNDGGLGTGETLTGQNGRVLCYSSDAHYFLDCDIEFPQGKIWTLPEDFSGSFAGPAEADEARLYNIETDTIYIQNQFQLAALAAEDRETSPVMSGDYNTANFGMGQFIYSNGEENGDYLSYGEEHHYVLSAAFRVDNSVQPRSLRRGMMRAAVSGPQPEGRDYVGQVSAVVDGTTYILIGDRQQLDAINANSTLRTSVCKPVYCVTEGAVEVWRTSAHITGDWIWLSEFDGSKDLKDGNGYGSTAGEVMASYEALSSSATVIYPGDADLVESFSQSPLYDVDDSGYHQLDRPGGTATNRNSTRDLYFTTNDSTGLPDLSTATLVSSDPTDGSLKYEKNGDYIVFRDIDMTVGALNGTDWRPLMFTGTMYGVKAADPAEISTLWNSDKTELALNTARKPEISNISVVPGTLTQLGLLRLDLNEQVGVGFFGTLSGDHSSSSVIVDPVIVNNLRLYSGTVTNLTTKGDVDASLVNGLLVFLGTGLGVILDPVLRTLAGKDIGVRELLTGLLNARAKDPASLATGAFAGRVIGDAQILNCEVESFYVETVATEYENDGKIVGKGGFVGYVEGETKYDTLSLLVGGVGDALTAVLNVIPGVGLGDLITVLLDNALPLRNLIPTGYSVPLISGCTVESTTLSTENGKFGVGGFAGSACGTDISSCRVVNCDMTVHADHFGGGFVGIERDAIIKGTLSGLGIDVLGALHPQSELLNCSILNSDLTVTGNTYLGGFVGAMANSYGINDTISGGSMTVSASGDFAGGFTGYAHLGTIFGFGDYLVESSSLLGTFKGLVTGLLGSGSDQSLLDVGGVAPSAILGVQITAPLSVSSDGAFVGGLVGRGNGTWIAPSSEEYLRKLGKYDSKTNGEYNTALPLTAAEARDNAVTQLIGVSAGGGKTDEAYNSRSYVGGLAGYLSSASVGGLLGNTAGIGQYLGFTVCYTTVQGVEAGYTVTAEKDCAGGGIGWAVGGDVYDVVLTRLRSVTALNRAGGFVGATGPGDLVSGNGLDLQLLGVSLIKIDQLLSLASGVRTTYLRADVSGIDSGFTVEESGLRDASDETEYMAGGWAAQANSVRVVDCHADRLLSVNANMHDAYAGGFVGSSSAGGLAGLVEESADLSVAEVGQLVDAVPYLVPSYDGCFVRFADGGHVDADTAGGFAGDFQSGKVNTYTDDDENPISEESYSLEHSPGYQFGTTTEPWSVYNIDHVRGGRYAGGWGGKVYSGALASAGSGLSVLGGAASATLSASQLLGVASVYMPTIRYAGVFNPTVGYTVYTAHDFEDDTAPATAGCAGGFIGYGSGVQVSCSDVYKLRHGVVSTPADFTASDTAAYERFEIFPDVLESQNGSSYMLFDNGPDAIPYAVAGARYAGRLQRTCLAARQPARRRLWKQRGAGRRLCGRLCRKNLRRTYSGQQCVALLLYCGRDCRRRICGRNGPGRRRKRLEGQQQPESAGQRQQSCLSGPGLCSHRAKQRNKLCALRRCRACASFFGRRQWRRRRARHGGRICRSLQGRADLGQQQRRLEGRKLLFRRAA